MAPITAAPAATPAEIVPALPVASSVILIDMLIDINSLSVEFAVRHRNRYVSERKVFSVLFA